VRAHLRAGIAVFNEGQYHAAHDAWEERWLGLEDGTDDERFLHGLIQFTAAVHHATNGNGEGARGLAESATEYLDGLGDTYRSVDLGAARRFLSDLATDPTVLADDDAGPPALRYEGDALGYEALGVEATAIAADILAEEAGFDPAPIERATTYARQDLSLGYEDSEFVALLFDFVREADDRALVHERLSAKVAKRARQEDDVTGLFD